MRTYPICLTLGQVHTLYEIAKLEIHELRELQRRSMAGEADCWGPEQMDRLRQWADLERQLLDRWYETLGEEMGTVQGSWKEVKGMDKLSNHREDVWPVPDLKRSDESQNEEGAERPAPFHPLFLKMIGSDPTLAD